MATRAPRPAAAAWLAALGVALQACSGHTGTDGAVVRDSAGVAIVEHHSALPEDGSWTLVSHPDVVVGLEDGAPEYLLSEVTGAAQLSDGRLAVVNRGSGEVRVYDRRGVFVRSIGRPGEGPGEFSSMELAGVLSGDTIVVSDLDLRRLTLLHPDAGVIRTAAISNDLHRWNWTIGLLDRLVVRGGIERYELSTRARGERGLERIPTSFQAATLEGDLATDFGVFPLRDVFYDIGDISGHRTTVAFDVPYGMEASFAARGEYFYYGSGERYDIRTYDFQGQLRRIIRWDRKRVQVTSADLEWLLQQQTNAAEDDREIREITRRFRDVPAPSHFPAYLGFVADRVGCLWVREYPRMGEDMHVYHVFDAEGRLAGRIVLPRELQVLEIGEDYLLALVRDDLHVEYLHRYRLARR